MMLQRAASNAYSWWWASHIRTKQSKWLEQNLQDMEEKVAHVIKLIEEDGDSFAKRAEMYYKKRPELINFVEESYKAYRALAERYDHISTELQNANTTIASVFPERVPFAMDDDDDDATPRRFPEVARANIPKVPKAPIKDLKSILSSTARKFQNKRTSKSPATVSAVSKSGLSKSEALEKIDKLQKDILALQTVKEFVKSSYEGGLTRYWEIEKQIADMQGEVSRLQDEFGEGMVIEDDEARTVMAAAALKSCQDTLASLQEKQKRSTEETKTEQRRVREAFDKFRSLQKELLSDQASECIGNEFSDELGISSPEEGNVQDREELKSIEEKVEEHFNAEINASLTVTEMAERMDQLVNKVIGLETEVSSQNALIERLRAEADDLHAQIHMLENEKASLAKGMLVDIGQKMRAVKAKFDGIQDLNRNVKQQNNFLQMHFTEAQCNLEHLSEKLHSVRPDEVQETASLNTDVAPVVEVKSSTNFKGQENEASVPERDQECQSANLNKERHDISLVEKQTNEVGVSDSSEKKEETLAQGELNEQRRVFSSGHDVNGEKKEETLAQGEQKKERRVFSSGDDMNGAVDSTKDDHPSTEEYEPNSSPQDSSKKSDDDSLQIEAQEQKTEEHDEPNWKELFTQGMEDREKTLLMEYTSILRNYKEVKKKLGEAEKKNQDGHFEATEQVKELKNVNAMKEEEIRSLRQKLSLLQTVVEGNKDLRSLSGTNNSQEPDKVGDQSTVSLAPETLKTPSLKEQESDNNFKLVLVDQPQESSEIEQKLRTQIDQILEENLNFWLRFSAAIHRIQKYETAVGDLHSEISQLEEKVEKQDSSHSSKTTAKSDMKPIYKHLREIQTELSVWLEKSLLLKDEQQCRFSSLCNIQEEITKALKMSAEDEDFTFTSYQAAKFQGEVLNMKQENNKVASELQAGLDHIATLQAEVQRSLAKLDGEIGISGPKDSKSPPLAPSASRNRVPLRSFIFGVKQKRQRPSIFHYVSPAAHRKYNVFRSGFSGQVSS